MVVMFPKSKGIRCVLLLLLISFSGGFLYHYLRGTAVKSSEYFVSQVADSVVVQTLPVSTSSTTKFTPENLSTSTTGRSSAVTAKDDELVLSQHPDIDERGEWQRGQVEAFCRKHHLESVEYQFPSHAGRGRLFRHLLFDDKRKLIFAFIPKVGCTNMRRFIFVMQGVIPLETIHWEHVDESKLLNGIMQASFLKHGLNDPQRLKKVRTYYKFTIIRNPLERLLSSYKDKFEPAMKYNFDDWLQGDRENLLNRHRAEELRRWKQGRGNFTLKISFQEFVEWVLETPKENMNEHFAPVIDNIYPCRIKYDFYGNFNRLGSDVEKIIKKLNVPPEYFYNSTQHKGGHETSDYLEEYYARLDKELKQKVFRHLYDDLDLYYNLFPEERNCHVRLLKIDELVV